MRVLNIIFMALGVIFAVTDGGSMLMDMVKNRNRLVDFLKESIEKSIKEIKAKGGLSTVYIVIILFMAISQCILIANLAVTTKYNYIRYALIAEAVMIMYLYIRNIVIIKKDKDKLDGVYKRLPFNAIILALCSVCQLLTVIYALLSMIVGHPVIIMLT